MIFERNKMIYKFDKEEIKTAIIFLLFTIIICWLVGSCAHTIRTQGLKNIIQKIWHGENK